MYLEGIARHKITTLKDTIVIARTTNYLGCIYKEQEKYNKAEKQYKRAFKGKQRLLEPNHKDTSRLISNLSYVYMFQGKYAKAKDLT